ncbi:MAG: hypothetical protein R2795_01505 [Saprospiraceae bacterium]
MNTIPDYATRASQFEHESERKQRRYERLAWMRLLAFILLVAGVILAWREALWWGGLSVTVAGIAGFAALIRRHGRLQEQAQHLQRLQLLNEYEARSLAHNDDSHW